MATTVDRQGSQRSSAASGTSDGIGHGIEGAARVGYAAKGVVYGVGDGLRSGWAAELMSMTFGVWLVGIVGAGVAIRGLMQFRKAYTQGFRDKISSFDLGAERSEWIFRVSRLGLTARGVVFGIIGSSIIYAAVRHDA